jgi:hypothetical protein
LSNFQLSTEVGGRRFSASVELKSADVKSRVVVAHQNSGDRYTLAHTPVVAAEISYHAVTQHGNEYSTESSSGTLQDINEKIKTSIVNGSTEFKSDRVAGRPPYLDYGYCTIETEIKPEYQDQFNFEPGKR